MNEAMSAVRYALGDDAIIVAALDDEEGGAVFDRLTGIEEFGLAQNFTARLFGWTLETDQWRVADCGDDIGFGLSGHGRNLKAPPGAFKALDF